jgi:hypothetical protein
MDTFRKTYFLFFLLLTVVSCSVIDEDQSDCGEQAQVDYELRLVTNMTTELQTQLTTQTDIQLASALKQHLSDIFTDFAHDVDLSFYDTAGDSTRLQHDEHIMDANQASYTLNLPMRHYMHLATANILDNEQVTLENDERCHKAQLHQVESDTIDSHTTGLFTARQPMEVLEGVDQNFNVHLYMANCAATLVIDPQGHSTEGLQVFTTGFATRFNICDSTYVFPAKRPIIRTNRVEIPDRGDEVGFTSVTFPSIEPHSTRTVIETEEPFIANADEEALWEIRVYVPHENGSKDEYVLGIKEPIRAGQYKIIRVRMGENGAIISESPEVGVSVTLDWKPGGEYNPDL